MSYDFVSLHPPYRQIFDCNIASRGVAKASLYVIIKCVYCAISIRKIRFWGKY